MCPSCRTDLALFDLGGASKELGALPEKEGRSIDEILASIMEGKEDHREIFETLKNVARESPESGEVLAEAKSTPVTETAKELGEQFLCPVCETLVASDATVCPSCGAEFSEGNATEYECPACKASVPADAERCPNCGVRFVEPATPPSGTKRAFETERIHVGAPSTTLPSMKAHRSPLQNRIDQLRRSLHDAERPVPTGDRKLLYRELPKLVNEVKPLLVSAKRIGLEIDDGKRIINEAIQAGKGRDIERAVTLIAGARRALDIAFVDFIGGRIDAFLKEVRIAKGDAGVQAVTPNLFDTVSRLEAGDYDVAWDLYQAALGSFQGDATEFHEARKLLEEGDRLGRDVREMGMDLRDSERLLRQAREALDRGDVAGSLRLGKQARDRLNQDVPAFVQEEMRKARNALLDLKVKGNDSAKPIGILKEASASAKHQAWGDAVRQIREFYKAIERFE